MTKNDNTLMVAMKPKVSTSEEKARQTAILQKQLWAVADVLRGQMDSSDYQKYMLGTIFYKYLSEFMEKTVREVYDEPTKNIELIFSEQEQFLKDEMIDAIGFYIEPNFLYKNILVEISRGMTGKWNTDYLKTAFTNFENSSSDFVGLFDDIDLDSNKLGIGINDRNNKMAEVLMRIGQIDFKLGDSKIDILGDAYEYLIGNFASDAGKKGGEFYTPQQVSILLAKILAFEKPDMKSVYDPTCGSGSLLLRVVKETQEKNAKLKKGAYKKSVRISGQELNTATFNLARMNMIMHGQKTSEFSLQNDNTLSNDRFEDITYNAVVSNPPYSAKWEHTKALESDERFVQAGNLAPKDKADFAFVQHCWHHLDNEGVASIVLPHGVLFRSGAEGNIRKWLLNNNSIHAVIGLPEKLFFGTGIATIIIVLKKGREEDEGVLFIDASKNFVKGKNSNFIEDSHLNTIMDAYKSREDVDKFAHLATLDEIKKNDYNLNITRYVDTSEDEVIIDLNEVASNIARVESEIATISVTIAGFISELHPVDSIPIKPRADEVIVGELVEADDKEDTENSLF